MIHQYRNVVYLPKTEDRSQVHSELLHRWNISRINVFHVSMYLDNRTFWVATYYVLGIIHMEASYIFTDGPNGCDYEQRNDVDIFRADQVRAAFSSEQCRSLCDGCKEFLCRSFSFFPPAALCALSSDDTLSVGSNALRARLGVSFYQRANCLDCKLINLVAYDGCNIIKHF